MERVIDAVHSGPDAAALLLADAVVPQVERALALIDLNPASATFGCADRGYWYYRTLTNFPGATWQQLMLALACVYRTAHPANPYHLDPRTASLVAALLTFWAKSQHADGAFDEWYLNEHSYCPTAITGAGAALTLHLMGDDLSAEGREAGVAALERAGRWLEPRYNAEVMNQNLAAAVALQGLATLLPSSRWDTVAREKIERIGRDQTDEGWFPEYGGMDFGYSTLALDLLAACRLLGAGSMIDAMAGSLCRLLVEVRGAGLAAPGRLGSRGTSHAFPFGAMSFAAVDANAALIAETQLRGLGAQRVPRPATIDDRYFAYFYLPQFALALHGAARGSVWVGPTAVRSDVSDLPASGIVVIRRADWSMTTSRRLGGAVALETPAQSPLYHLGYEVTTDDGVRYSSATLSEGDRAVPYEQGKPIEISTSFRAVSSGLPLRRLMVPFQAIVYMLRWSGAAKVFQALIKRKMISPKRSLALRLVRTVDVGTQSARIVDRLIPEAGLVKLTRLDVAPAVSMHSPSSRQESARTLTLTQDETQRAIALLNSGTTVSLTFAFDPTHPQKEMVDVHLQPGDRSR